MGSHSRMPRPLWVCLRRGMRLVCPECGVSPVFVPMRKVRSLFDWFTPLDGCPRCGYAYQREEGYFLLATWVVNYSVVAGLGLGTSLLIEFLRPMPLKDHILYVFVPMPILSMLLVRHAKSVFLALDHYFDPHVKKPGADLNPES